jgi:Trypsin-like peptidase domain
MAVLRTLFSRRGDGVWAIQHLLSVPLDPVDGGSDDFYRLRENFIGSQPNFMSTIHTVMGQTIVPIVAMVPGENVVRCLGTGFFVSCSGLLVTAAHVIADPIERKYGGIRKIGDLNRFTGDLNLGVMIRTNPLFQRQGYIFRPIEWAGFLAEHTESPLPFKDATLKLNSDTAICVVTPLGEGIPYQPLTVVQPGIRGIGLDVGKRATAVGCGDMENVEISRVEGAAQGSERAIEGDFRFNLYVSKGKILERFPDNATTRQASTPGACFSASLKLPAGMSGSPIFDDEGIYVHGVVSKGLEDAKGPTNHGYGSMLSSSLGVPIEHFGQKSLLELMKDVKHGIPKIGAPGI